MWENAARVFQKVSPATDAPEAPEADSNGEFDEAELSIVSDRLLPDPLCWAVTPSGGVSLKMLLFCSG